MDLSLIGVSTFIFLFVFESTSKIQEYTIVTFPYPLILLHIYMTSYLPSGSYEQLSLTPSLTLLVRLAAIDRKSKISVV